MLINKAIIKNNFSSAAKNYDEFAVVQNLAAKKVSELVFPYLKNNSKILDLGAGNGFVAKNILDKSSDQLLVAIDHLLIHKEAYDKQPPLKNEVALHEMKSRRIYPKLQIFEIDLVRPIKKNQNTFFIQGDMEKPCFNDNSFDLITSSFALQWMENLEQSFIEFHKILKPNGIFIFAVPMDESLSELKNASVNSGCDFHFNQLPKREKLEKIFEKSGFNLLNLYQETIKQRFVSGIDAIKSIKKIGANYSLQRQNKITKIQLKKFDNSFKSTSNAQFCEISWLVNYFILSK
jgi:malonyl-CoA O-methyltransferase